MSDLVKAAGELLVAIEEKSLEIEFKVRQQGIDAQAAREYFTTPAHAMRVQALATLLAPTLVKGRKGE